MQRPKFFKTRRATMPQMRVLPASFAASAVREELLPLLRMAGPVVLAELGWMAMTIEDTIMVGRVSPAAIGAVAIGGNLFYTVAVFGIGLLLGLDTLISQSFGAGDIDDCHRSLFGGLYLALFISPVLMLATSAWVPLLRIYGIDPLVLRDAIPFFEAMMWGVFPLLVYVAARRYLQAMSLVKPVMFSLVTANLVNIAGNWILVFGHWGFPAMGARGSGWSTFIARVYMAGSLVVYILYHAARNHTGLARASRRPDWTRMNKLVNLGLPAALQISVEVAIFALTSVLIAKISATWLAAHQIALSVASVTFMVPLGISSASAVRVGQAIGRKDAEGAARSGWTSILLGGSVMFCFGIFFWLAPRFIAHIFTPDEAVTSAAAKLLLVAALFQLFDGIQTVATGALRGAGDTKSPLVAHLLFYWVVGLPIGIWLGFGLNWGAVGLWIGLCVALILIGIALLIVWERRVHSLSRALAIVSP